MGNLVKERLVASGLALLVGFAMALSGAKAETKVYTFSAEHVPTELLATAMQVSAGDVTMTLTFAGDATLGGEQSQISSVKSFQSLVKFHGMAFPFQELRSLFATDDLTVVNLEGVLSDSVPEKTQGKQFNFIGEESYTAILRAGSVECVNLANNHTMDFGEEGYRDTVAALERDGIAYIGEDAVTVLEKDGVRIGLTGSLFALDGDKQGNLERQIEALQSVGCQWIVHTLHAGVEYDAKPSQKQRSVAEFVAGKGVSLMVGHHPHVVQGMDMIGNMPILYSLGNSSFGGNLRPKDYDACVLRAEVRFSGGELTSLQLTLFPIRISGEKKYNNFQPVLLTGKDAERVMKKIQESSKISLSPYVEGEGAVQPEILYKGQKEAE